MSPSVERPGFWRKKDINLPPETPSAKALETAPVAMGVSVALNTPLADALNEVVQPKLVELGWSTGGGDDSALAEYVILMLVNGKTQDQISAELANDLLSLGPEDTEAAEFSKWLFEQVETLDARLNGASKEAPQEQPPQAIPSFSDEANGGNGNVTPADTSVSQSDMDMDEGSGPGTDALVYVLSSLSPIFEYAAK